MVRSSFHVTEALKLDRGRQEQVIWQASKAKNGEFNAFHHHCKQKKFLSGGLGAQCSVFEVLPHTSTT